MIFLSIDKLIGHTDKPHFKERHMRRMVGLMLRVLVVSLYVSSYAFAGSTPPVFFNEADQYNGQRQS
jgi:hypothetical protein